MMRLCLLATAIALGLTAAPAAAETETVCRPTTLGNLRCSGPAARPEPRPIYRVERGLDQVQEPTDPADRRTRFVPAREINRLGTTLTNDPLPGRCRPDRLGNVYCQ